MKKPQIVFCKTRPYPAIYSGRMLEAFECSPIRVAYNRVTSDRMGDEEVLRLNTRDRLLLMPSAIHTVK